jgi:L-serine dehydratase
MPKLYTIQGIVSEAESQQIPICEVVIQYEMQSSSTTREEIMRRMAETLQVMKDAAEKGMQESEPTRSGMISNEANRMATMIREGKTLAGGLVPLAIAKALSVSTVNAKMGKIVAGPTAGSCGIVPGSMLAVAEVKGLSDETLIRGLLTAAGLGTVVARKATLAGAAGGCQAECGVATAMAAGGIVEMMGGTPAQVSAAFALALKNLLGLVCDPVAGLVEVPCVKRNAMAASHAIAAAELALAGIASVIPADEVIEAMSEIGDELPRSLKETALGGLATTPSGKRVAEEFFGVPNR